MDGRSPKRKKDTFQPLGRLLTSRDCEDQQAGCGLRAFTHKYPQKLPLPVNTPRIEICKQIWHQLLATSVTAGSMMIPRWMFIFIKCIVHSSANSLSTVQFGKMWISWWLSLLNICLEPGFLYSDARTSLPRYSTFMFGSTLHEHEGDSRTINTI